MYKCTHCNSLVDLEYIDPKTVAQVKHTIEAACPACGKQTVVFNKSDFDINSEEQNFRTDCAGHDDHWSWLRKDDNGWKYEDCCGIQYLIGETDVIASFYWLNRSDLSWRKLGRRRELQEGAEPEKTHSIPVIE